MIGLYSEPILQDPDGSVAGKLDLLGGEFGTFRGHALVGGYIDSRTILELSGEFDVTERTSLFGSVHNLTDEECIIAFRPDRVRRGAPRTRHLFSRSGIRSTCTTASAS